MHNFNKYGYIEDLTDLLLQAILYGDLENADYIHDHISADLDNQVIYYQDCFEIAEALSLTSFTGYELGDATNISQLAYFGLWEWATENLDYNFIENAINAKEEFELFVHSDNCINIAGGLTQTQCTQYGKNFTFLELFKYYLTEYAN
jgi:hypothetical protein